MSAVARSDEPQRVAADPRPSRPRSREADSHVSAISGTLSIRIDTTDELPTIFARGYLSENNAELVMLALRSLRRTDPGRPICVDLTGVHHADAAGARVLFSAQRDSAGDGGRVQLRLSADLRLDVIRHGLNPAHSLLP